MNSLRSGRLDHANLRADPKKLEFLDANVFARRRARRYLSRPSVKTVTNSIVSAWRLFTQHL
ncbi:MAG: hypothetical protein DWH97_10220 [Planctomycetota bacterium]|nr:MAG: hypothetical protein DWH97_10220 [Planctomycetota bacterium]